MKPLDINWDAKPERSWRTLGFESEEHMRQALRDPRDVRLDCILEVQGAMLDEQRRQAEEVKKDRRISVAILVITSIGVLLTGVGLLFRS